MSGNSSLSDARMNGLYLCMCFYTEYSVVSTEGYSVMSIRVYSVVSTVLYSVMSTRVYSVVRIRLYSLISIREYSVRSTGFTGRPLTAWSYTGRQLYCTGHHCTVVK